MQRTVSRTDKLPRGMVLCERLIHKLWREMLIRQIAGQILEHTFIQNLPALPSLEEIIPQLQLSPPKLPGQHGNKRSAGLRFCNG